MVRDPELRRLLEREADLARKEYQSPPSSPPSGQVSQRREELRKRYEEADALLGRRLPHERIISNQKKNQIVTLVIALLFLLFAVVWGIFALGTKAKLHGIDANIRRLVERYTEQGLRPK